MDFHFRKTTKHQNGKTTHSLLVYYYHYLVCVDTTFLGRTNIHTVYDATTDAQIDQTFNFDSALHKAKMRLLFLAETYGTKNTTITDPRA